LHIKAQRDQFGIVLQKDVAAKSISGLIVKIILTNCGHTPIPNYVAV